MKKLIVFLCVLGAQAFGGYSYNFSFMPTDGTVQAFSFEIDSPGVPLSGSLSFTPFAVNDGVSTMQITQGVAGLENISGTNYDCFAFGTAAEVLGSDCGTFLPGSNSGLAVLLDFIPTPAASMQSPGVYSIADPAHLIWSGLDSGQSILGRGNLTLTISETPEPTSGSLCVLGLLAIVGVFVRNRRTDRPQREI